ncbi:hypothetical protein H2200_004720 [Cladophialophora chaetospira]|uniref:Uncharacterized protein n=1 Tax=Cladophialophora chaetospira TaxID=386627 RepID=A0AA39CKS2_9EURO|nr:hypothetical protein H2200_004720 [Cladophialophora chaetospira]
MAGVPPTDHFTQHGERQCLVGQHPSVPSLDVRDDTPVSPISESPASDDYHAVRGHYPATAVTEKSRTPPRENAQAKNTTCVLALAALAAIVITLALHEGKTLPKWPSMISINSLIAVFTAILKAAMLLPIAEGLSEMKWMWFATSRPLTDLDRLDLASRGPWGSFLLVFMRPNLLAYLGALVTVVALAIDPFAQQILQYYECMTPLPDSSATIVRTNSYSASGFHTGALEQSLDGVMAAALYQGVLAPPANATASIAFECASGNCTFPATDSVSYISLAMCSSVEDISHSITGNGSQYYYTLPSDLTTHQATMFSIGGEGVGITADAPLFSFEALMINCKGSANKTTGICETGPWAFRAALYPCINTYGDVKVSKSILQEQKLSTTRVPFMGMNGGFYFSLAGEYPSFPGLDCTPTNKIEGNNTVPTSLLPNGVRYINDSVVAGAADTMWFNPACTYEFGLGSVEALTEYLGSSFFGWYSDPYVLQEYAIGPSYTIGRAWLERLYANGTANVSSVSSFMDGLANTMTATMRQRGDAEKSVPATGTVLATTTCIRVRWAWLSLPAALLASTMVFFVAVMVRSRQNTRTGAAQGGRRPWMSSSLPLLWCGLDDETKRRYGVVNDLRTMQERGDRVKVSLGRRFDGGPGEGRWGFQEAQSAGS